MAEPVSADAIVTPETLLAWYRSGLPLRVMAAGSASQPPPTRCKRRGIDCPHGPHGEPHYPARATEATEETTLFTKMGKRQWARRPAHNHRSFQKRPNDIVHKAIAISWDGGCWSGSFRCLLLRKEPVYLPDNFSDSTSPIRFSH